MALAASPVARANLGPNLALYSHCTTRAKSLALPMRSFFMLAAAIAIGLVCSLVHATPFSTLTCSSFDNVAGAIQMPHQAALVASRHWNELDDVQGSRQAWTTAVGRRPAVRWRFHSGPSVLDSPRIRTRLQACRIQPGLGAWPGLPSVQTPPLACLPVATRCCFLCLATHWRTLDRSHTASKSPPPPFPRRRGSSGSAIEVAFPA